MIAFDSLEYKVLEECLAEWNSVIAKPLPSGRLSRDELSELLIRRDNAYRAYRKVHGNPTPDEIRVLESHPTQTLMLTGSPWLWIKLNEFTNEYNLGSVSLDYMSMTIVFLYDDTDLSSSDAHRMSKDFPHWNLELAKDRDDY